MKVENHHYPDLHPFFGIRPWKRHSMVLMVAGLVYVGIGASYMFVDTTVERTKALGVVSRIAPFDVWGLVFMLSGILAIISSRWPPISKTWGYTVLTGLSAGWGAAYAVGVIFIGTPAMNLSGAAVWGLIAFMWWAISGLHNPDDVRANYGPC